MPQIVKANVGETSRDPDAAPRGLNECRSALGPENMRLASTSLAIRVPIEDFLNHSLSKDFGAGPAALVRCVSHER
jgi:hypothetical protein